MQSVYTVGRLYNIFVMPCLFVMIFKFVKGLSNQYTKNLRSQLGDDDTTCSTFFGLWVNLVFLWGNKSMNMMSILHTLSEYLIHKGGLARLYACMHSIVDP